MKALALLKALAFLKALVAAAVAIVREGPQQLCRVWVVIAEAKTLPGQALETSADRSIPWRQKREPSVFLTSVAVSGLPGLPWGHQRVRLLVCVNVVGTD